MPSTRMFIRPSSKRSSTRSMLALHPISLSPSSESQTIPKSVPASRHSPDHRPVAVLEDVQRKALLRQQHEAEREQRKALDRVAHVLSVLRLDGCRSATHWPGWSPTDRRGRWRSFRRAWGSSGSSSSRRTRGPSARCRRPWRRSRRPWPTSTATRTAAAVPLREALAERHGVPPEQVVLGNGADELIRLCAVATLDPGDAAAFSWPSFPSYATAARCGGAEPIAVPLAGRACRPRRAARGCPPAAHEARLPRQPEQPDGRLGGRSRSPPPGQPATQCPLRARRGLRRVRRPGARGPGAGALRGAAAVRAAHLLQGLRPGRPARSGYALASPDVADALDRVRPIFNVNQPAQEAALASLGEVRRGGAARGPRPALARAAVRRRSPAPVSIPSRSQANFVYADVPDGDGAALAGRLLREEGMLVRELPGFGAPAGHPRDGGHRRGERASSPRRSGA